MHFALTDLLAEYAGSALLTANTLRLHQTGCQHFSAFLGRTALVSDLTDPTLCRYISSRVAAGKSRATVRGEVAKLLALWRYAAKRHYVDEWPTVRPPRAPERAPLAWTHLELDRLFAATTLAGPVGDVPGFLWWGALASCLWDSGERIGAMLALEWYGVDLAGRTLVIPAEVRKGQACERVGKGQVLWEATEATPPEPPFSSLQLPDAAALLLGEAGPLRPVEIVVALQERGYRRDANPRILANSLLAALRRCSGRFSCGEDGRWGLGSA